MLLEDIIKICEWAAGQTREVIPYSSNLPDPKRPLSHRNLYLEASRHRDKAIIDEIFGWHLDLSSDRERYPLSDSEVWLDALNEGHGGYIKFKDLIKLVKKLPHGNKKRDRSDLEWAETLAVKALKFGIGNCAEVSAYAMFLLLEYPQEGLPGLPAITGKISVERLSFLGSDGHTLLVVNRTQGDLTDILSWNDDAVFCDPWTKEVYTKRDLLANKNEAEIKLIQSKFKNLTTTMGNELSDFYMGCNNNNYTHTGIWYSKHNNSKWWRPRKLISVTKRPQFVEQLPKTRKAEPKPLKIRLVLNNLEKIAKLTEKSPTASLDSELVAELKELISRCNPEERLLAIKQPIVQAYLLKDDSLFQATEELRKEYITLLLKIYREGYQELKIDGQPIDNTQWLFAVQSQMLKQMKSLNLPEINPSLLNEPIFLNQLCNMLANLLSLPSVESTPEESVAEGQRLVGGLYDFITQNNLYQKVSDHIVNRYLDTSPVKHLLKKYADKKTSSPSVIAWQAMDTCIKENKKECDPKTKISKLYSVLHQQNHFLSKVRNYHFVFKGNPFRAIYYGLLNLRRPTHSQEYFDPVIVDAAKLGMHQGNLSMFKSFANKKLNAVLKETQKLQKGQEEGSLSYDQSQDRIDRIRAILATVNARQIDSVAAVKDLYADLHAEIKTAQDNLRAYEVGGRYGLLDNALTELGQKLIKRAKENPGVTQPRIPSNGRFFWNKSESTQPANPPQGHNVRKP